MPRFAAFLRGMNLGGRRLTNGELCAHVGAIGFGDVRAFLASGNVVLEAPTDDPESIVRSLEEGLAAALDYEVPAFVRTAGELRAIADREPFAGVDLGGSKGKPQVALLRETPSPESRDAVLALGTDRDRVVFFARELHWLPVDGISGSELDWAAVERLVGTTTVRTGRTIERLLEKFFSAGA